MIPFGESRMLRVLFVLCIFLSGFVSTAQVPPAASNHPDSLKVVQILSADRYGYQKKDSLTELLLLVGNVALKQENTIFNSDSAVYNRQEKIVEAFGNVHINDNDSIHTYSDYLLYHTDTKIATLKKNVRLTDGKSNLYTEELEYDINQKTGIYRNGGRVVNGTSVLTSDEATYYADLKDVYFKQHVRLKDPKYNLESDSLLYNTQTELTTFITKTYIEDSAKRTIVTSEGYYDLGNKKASFGKRPVIKDGAVTIIANRVDTNDSTGINILTGNAVFKDTAQGVSILANSIVSNRNTGSMLATLNPLMILKQDNDSTFITADTLYSGTLEELAAEITHNDSVAKARALEDSLLQVRSQTDSLTAIRPHRNPPAVIARRDSAAVTALLAGKDSAANTVPLLPGDSVARKEPAPDNASLPEKDSISANAPLAKKDSAQDNHPPPNIARVGRRADTLQQRDTALLVAGKPALPVTDTLVSGPMPKSQNDSAARFFRAFRHVRIFSDSMQAVCDSLFYSGADSAFRLFYEPILWASNSQVTGDTIYLYTKNKKADELFVNENGLMINKTGEDMFNQIKGNRLFGYFKEGDIDYIRAKGNAESIYYAKDNEDKLVGINKASSDIIDMRFLNKELNRVVFISAVTGSMLPYREATEQDKRLRNFQWHEDKRPKSKFELFGN